MHLKKILNLCLFGFTTELSIVPLAFANDVYAEGPLPTVVDIVSLDDGKRPDIPKGSGFAVVKLKIQSMKAKIKAAL